MYYFASNKSMHKIINHIKDDQRWWCVRNIQWIWNKIKKALNIELHSMPVYDEKYIKAKVREFNSVIKTNFLGDEVPK